MLFTSPTKGQVTFDELFQDLAGYTNEFPDDLYKLVIGTDSHSFINDCVIFVTAVVVHRIGKGGRFYYHKQKTRYMESLRQRIYYETFLSLEVATRLTERLAQNGDQRLNVEIHLDVGEKGETRDMIKEVVGMVIGSGYRALIKPDSFGATTVADRFTR
ncbi:MAG TPA: ribonuclease H-like YkuK family protein [Candidatus Limnocylindrales bacterium]|nr:ribonuclease H-like YkuK family protein [Candidatus Limnocylindrales bacterium]